MHFLELLDNRLFSILLSLIIFLAVFLGIQRIYIPESEPLTAQIKIIEEIRKFIRPPEPEPREMPRETKKIQPRKRIVPERIESALNKLRESQTPKDVAVKQKPEKLVSPKLDLRRPTLRKDDRRPSSRIKMDDTMKEKRVRSLESSKVGEKVIEIARGSDIEYGDDSDATLDRIVSGGKKGPGTGAGNGDDVMRFSIEPWDGYARGEDVISGVMEPLIEWIMNNPAEFSSVEQKFLRFDGGDLTSRATFILEGEGIDGVKYELLLLFKTSIKELRICLIEGNTAIQLIDKGLLERSNYLRTGSVVYSGLEKISIQSTQKVPSDEATKHFYQIFMTWWKRVKDSG
jgi:hypothetical protein